MPEKLNLKIPLIFAHRGANSFAPENSLPAFQKAIELGCQGIELDVRYTADKNVVVFHDKNTFRLTGVRQNIQKLTLSQIKKFKLHQKDFPEEKIPTLSEVLEIVRDKVLINIDVKKGHLIGNGFEEKILKILQDFRLVENVIISSFNPFVLKKIASLNPVVHLGYIFRNRTSLFMLNGQSVQSLHPSFRILNQRYISHLKEKTNWVYAWTVDNAHDMLDLIKNKVDGIISNKPEVFFQLIDKIRNTKILTK